MTNAHLWLMVGLAVFTVVWFVVFPRVAAWMRARDDERLRRSLRAESIATLTDRIVCCGYFDRRMRDHPVVSQFLQRLEAGEYAALFHERGDWFTRFVQAERELGNDSRPYLIDYDMYLARVLEELNTRMRETVSS